MGRPSDARQRLIAAANKVIYAHSYEGVTVDELCVAAGVTKSSFYHFFASKQELVLVALESQWQRFEETLLLPAFSDHLPPQERMLREAKEQGIVPASLDTAVTAQALLAYFEGVMLLAKGRNDPALIASLRAGTLALMQYQGERASYPSDNNY